MNKHTNNFCFEFYINLFFPITKKHSQLKHKMKMIIYATRLPTGRDEVRIDEVDSVPVKRLLVGRNVSDAAAAISAGVAESLRPTDLRRPFALSIVPDDGRDLDLERLRNSFFGGDLLLSLSPSDPVRDLDRVRRTRCDLDVKGDVEDDDIK